MISHVSASALKGATFSHDLSAVSLILGDNAAGKSSIIDALQLGMRGSHPVLGKTASSIMALASGPEMVVGITDTLAGKVRRVWKRSGDKCSASNTEPLPEFPDLVGSATQYLALSPAKRVEYVAGLVTVTDAAFSFEAVTAEVKNVRLEANSEASEKAIKDYLDAITRDSVHAAPLQRIGTMLTIASDRLKSAKQTCARMKGVVTGTEQLRALDAQAEQSGADTDRNLATARQRLSVLQGNSGALSERVTAAARAAEHRRKLEAVKSPEGIDETALLFGRDHLAAEIAKWKQKQSERAESTQEVYGRVMGIMAERGAMVGARNSIGERLAALRKMQSPADVHSLKDELLALGRNISNAVGNRERRLMTVDQLVDRIGKFQTDKASQAEKYRHAGDQIKVGESAIEMMLTLTCCPTCAATGTEWKTRVQAEREKTIAEHRAILDAASKEGKRLKAEIEIAQAKLAEWRKEDSDLIAWTARESEITATIAKCDTWRLAQDQIKELTAEYERMEQCVAQLEKQKQAAELLCKGLTDEDLALENIQRQHDAIVTTLANAADSLNRYRAAQQELAAAAAPESTENLSRERAELSKAIEEIRTEIATLEQARNRVIAQRADIKRQMEAGKLLEQSEAEVEVLKAIQELLREKQSQLVTKAFTPLLTVVNKFVSGVAPLQGLRGQPLEMVIQYRDGHLGFDRDGVWVSDETFNESLSLLVFAGLAVALAAAAPQRIVILDEFTRVIGLTKFNAVRRLAELVQQGVIDQAIVVDGYDAQYVPLVSTVQGKELISIIRL